jgi:Tol biopolymer transport system component
VERAWGRWIAIVVGAVALAALLGAGPAWATSPGLNGRIAFASTRDGGGIFTLRPNGTALRRLTSGDDSQPAWSPDGRWLAFTHISLNAAPSGIYLIRADGHRGHFLVDGEQASWSANGHRLVYTGEDAQGNIALAIVRRDGSHAHPIGVVGTDPSWSPQGGVIAFVARTPATGVRDIYLLHLADHQVTNLTQNVNDPDLGIFETASGRTGHRTVRTSLSPRMTARCPSASTGSPSIRSARMGPTSTSARTCRCRFWRSTRPGAGVRRANRL